MSALGAGRLLFGPLLLTQSGRHADVPQRPMQSLKPLFHEKRNLRSGRLRPLCLVGLDFYAPRSN
jgi:hypothetical protein